MTKLIIIRNSKSNGKGLTIKFERFLDKDILLPLDRESLNILIMFIEIMQAHNDISFIELKEIKSE